MDKVKLNAFIIQIGLQCSFALEAYARLNVVATTNAVPLSYAYIQSFLTAAANVSKLLWDSGLQTERIVLRNALGVSDDSPLFGRNIRNDFDHIDDRLDTWRKRSKTYNYVDMNFRVTGNMSIKDGVPEDIFRDYDPDTKTLIFWGSKLDLGKMCEAVVQIEKAVEAHQGFLVSLGPLSARG
jgi:hypothetical protein